MDGCMAEHEILESMLALHKILNLNLKLRVTGRPWATSLQRQWRRSLVCLLPST